MTEKSEVIPKIYLDFCRDVSELAKKIGLNSLSVSMTPGYFDNNWRNKIQMHWEQGRHGEDSYACRVSSTVDVAVKLDKTAGEAT